MEQGLRSNEVFMKKKSPTGCLIIKKKPELSSGVVETLPSKGLVSNERRDFVGLSVLGSSENSLEPNRRGILRRDNRFYNSSTMYGEGNSGNKKVGRNVEFEDEGRRNFDKVEFSENIGTFGKGVLGNNRNGRNVEFEGERIRKLNNVEYDENVGVSGEGIVGNTRFSKKVQFEGISGNNKVGRDVAFEGERRRNFDKVELDNNFGTYSKGVLGYNKNGPNVEFEGEKIRKFNNVEYDENVGVYGEGVVGNNTFGQNVEFEGERRRKFNNVEFDENVGTYGKGIVGNSRNGRKREFEGILGNNRNGQKPEFGVEKRRKFDDVEFDENVGMCAKGIMGNNKSSRNGELEGILGNNRLGRHVEFEGEKRRKFDNMEDDENVGTYGKRMRMDDIEDRYANRRELEPRSIGYGVKGNTSSPCLPLRQKFPVHSDKPIRVQGKNGVLKVMLNKSKNAHILHQFYGNYIEDVNKSGSKLGSDVNVNLSVGPSLYSGVKNLKNADSSIRTEKNELVLHKVSPERTFCELNMQMTYTSSDYQQPDLVKWSSNVGIDKNKNAPATLAFSSDSELYKTQNLLLKGKKSEYKLQNKSIKMASSGYLKMNVSDSSSKPKSSYNSQLQTLVNRDSILETDRNKNALVIPVVCSDAKLFKEGNSLLKGEKSDIELRGKSSKNANSGHSKSDAIDSAIKAKASYDNQRQYLARKGPNLEVGINKKAPMTPVVCSVSNLLEDGNSLPKGETKVVFVAHKETKVKPGAEKQALREKIRHMLLKAGWTINYKPRKNGVYQDMVYVNPAGTTYWSIIKAYEEFKKKQVGEEDVPEELLKKLTRQTRKKMQNDLKIKQMEEARGKIGEDVAVEEAEEDSEGDPNGEENSFSTKQKDSNSHVIPERKTENDNNDGKQSFSSKKNDSNAHVIPERKTENDNNDVNQIFSSKKNGKSLERDAEKPSINTNSHTVHERKTQQTSGSTLLVCSSIKSSKSQNDDYVPYTGNRSVLAWLIDFKIVQEGAQVEYMNRNKTKIMLKGWISKDGIHCECCDKIITVSEFESHTGSKLQQPYKNIYLENGVSLLQCLIDGWNKQDKAKRCGFYDLNIDDVDENDDVCGLCGDGGDLMCCDGCPSTFHQSCIGIKTLPLGDWHCPNCTCKFCERSNAQGNALLTCTLCERKYHESCKEDIDVLSDGVDRDTTFCGKKCEEVYIQLQKLLEVKHELEGGFSWSLIHRTDIDTDTTQLGFPQKVECNSKLAVALSVIEECFLPIHDRRSGINMIHNVVYNRGSNYRRFNHSGFYTAILERGDEIIAAASIRIHGTQLAEMPFIGTRQTHRRQGMCRRLLSAIESALSSLKVGQLIIHVVDEDMPIWTGVFGFNPLEKSLKKEMRSLNILAFPKTKLLQKILVEQTTSGEHLYVESGTKSSLSKVQHLCKPKVKKGTRGSKFGHASDVGDYSSLKSPTKTTERTAPKNSCLLVNECNENASSKFSSDDHSCENGTTEDVNEAVEPISDKETNL